MLQLFGHPFSSYTWKALIAIYDRGTVRLRCGRSPIRRSSPPTPTSLATLHAASHGRPASTR